MNIEVKLRKAMREAEVAEEELFFFWGGGTCAYILEFALVYVYLYSCVRVYVHIGVYIWAC